MVHVKFKNFEKSEVMRDIVTERITEAVGRFPKGGPRIVVVTLGMENSPLKAGPDLFTVRTEVIGGRYHGVILEKAAHDIYVALAQTCEGLLERLNRHSDRLRTQALKQKRSFATSRRRESLKVSGTGK